MPGGDRRLLQSPLPAITDAFTAANPDQVAVRARTGRFVRMGDQAPAADALLDLAWDWLGERRAAPEGMGGQSWAACTGSSG